MASVAVDMWVNRSAGNQAGTALAVVAAAAATAYTVVVDMVAVGTVVADMVVVAIHSMAFVVLVAVGCPAVDARSSLFLSRA